MSSTFDHSIKAEVKTNIDDIEDIQRAAFRIIFKGQYKSYSDTLEILGERTLEDRRRSITLKFAKKCILFYNLCMFVK